MAKDYHATVKGTGQTLTDYFKGLSTPTPTATTAPIVAPKTNTTTATTTPTPTNTTSPDSNALYSAIQKQLLNNSGMVSSSMSDIESRINKAIGSIGQGAKDNASALESEYQRERSFAEGQADVNFQGALESRSGFGTSMVAFRNLTETTDKNLKDLAQRKNELILQGNAQAAGKIADLEIKALEYKQKATQDVFNNLFSLGNLGNSIENTNIQNKKFEQDVMNDSIQNERLNKEMEDKKIADIGKLLTENPQAGIEITDSIEDAYRKIGINPNSPDMLYKKAQIENIYSEMRKRNQASGTNESSTETERKAAKLSNFMTLITPGATLLDGSQILQAQEIKVNGKRMLDNFITPSAFIKLSKTAADNGIDRKDFIASLGGLIYKGKDNKKIDEAYRLTPADLKIINGK